MNRREFIAASAAIVVAPMAAAEAAGVGCKACESLPGYVDVEFCGVPLSKPWEIHGEWPDKTGDIVAQVKLMNEFCLSHLGYAPYSIAAGQAADPR